MLMIRSVLYCGLWQQSGDELSLQLHQRNLKELLCSVDHSLRNDGFRTRRTARRGASVRPTLHCSVHHRPILSWTTYKWRRMQLHATKSNSIQNI